MSEVKQIVLSICSALIIIGYIIKLAPVGKGQKTIKGILSLIIILIITAPLTSAVNIDTDFKINTKEQQTNLYNNLIEEPTVNLLQKRIEDLLNENAIAFNSVDITVLKSTEGSRISAISIYVNNPQNITKIKTLLRKEMGLDVSVAVLRE